MAETETLHAKLEDLKKAKENFSKIVIAAGQFEALVESIHKLLLRESSHKRDKDLKELELLDGILIPGTQFKPTAIIADYIRRKSQQLEHLNNMQLGILLSKGGFKSGVKQKKRGYYITYKEL